MAVKKAPPRRRANRAWLLLPAAAIAALGWAWSATEEGASADEQARAHLQAQRALQAKEVEVLAAEFHGAWTRSDLVQVKSYLHDALHDAFWPQVLAVLDRRGWSQSLPHLAPGVVSDRGDGSFDVRFALAGGEPLVTRWMCADGVWRIGRLLLPPQ